MINALLAQFHETGSRSRNPTVANKATYASKAAQPGDRPEIGPATAKAPVPKKKPIKDATPESREDSRVLVRLPTDKQLNRDQPYILRSILATRINRITLINVPDITLTRTG